MLARELLSRPDGFLTATYGEEEYVIKGLKRKSTHANLDDGVMHWTFNLQENIGNIVR